MTASFVPTIFHMMTIWYIDVFQLHLRIKEVMKISCCCLWWGVNAHHFAYIVELKLPILILKGIVILLKSKEMKKI